MTWPHPIIAPPNTRLPATLLHTDSRTTNTAGSSYTWNNVAIGTASADRLVIIAAFTTRSTTGGARSITSLTIGGVAGTPVTTELQFNTQATINIFYRLVTSGTTLTVVMNLDGNNFGASIDAYILKGQLSNAPTATNKTSGNNPSMTLNVPSLGAVVGQGGGLGASVGAMTWTGLTKNSDRGVGTGANKWSSAASAQSLSADPAYNIALASVASVEGMLAAAWN